MTNTGCRQEGEPNYFFFFAAFFLAAPGRFGLRGFSIGFGW